jgi:hypothetical protein
MNEYEPLARFEQKAVRGKWFEVNDINNLTTEVFVEKKTFVYSNLHKNITHSFFF